jgi:hypothetical protein
MGLVASYGTKGTEVGATVIRHDYQLSGRDRGIIHCHGRGGTPADATVLGGGLFYVIQACGAIAPNIMPTLGGTTTWGNDVSQTKLGDAITYLQGTLGAASGTVCIYAASMGALTALNYYRANPTKVAAIALGMPAVDLAYEHDNNIGGWAVEIETAYGGTSAYNAAVAGHDPMQHTSDFTGVPMKVWYASDDTAAITARQQAFISATGCQSQNLGAVGHTLTAVPADEVVAFFKNYL